MAGSHESAICFSKAYLRYNWFMQLTVYITKRALSELAFYYINPSTIAGVCK